MSLDALHRKLIELARQRVRSGEVTERGLARLCGVSQPHMHNALKEIRVLSTAVADRLLQVLDLSIPELLWRIPGEEELDVRAIPVLRNRIGPGTRGDLAQFSGFIPVSGDLLKGVVQPVCARVGPDLVLPKAFSVNDVLLLDQDPVKRAAPRREACWVVSAPGGLSIRYVRLEAGRIYLAGEAAGAEDARWDSTLPGNSTILETVKARVVWLGRQLSTLQRA